MPHHLLPIPPPCTRLENLASIFKHEVEEEFLKKLPTSVRDALLPSYDPGVLSNELVDLKLYSRLNHDDPTKVEDAGGNIAEGTYGGTQVALTQVYSQIEQR
jgi:hypothetical protein